MAGFKAAERRQTEAAQRQTERRHKQQLVQSLEAANKRREEAIMRHKKVPGVPMRHIHDGNLPTGAHLALEAEARRAARVPKPDRGACLDAPHVTESAPWQLARRPTRRPPWATSRGASGGGTGTSRRCRRRRRARR
ncbi:unnamed protein product [Prorocentrum cordatum]|uniref:Ribosome biogenesis protein NOP53 n=1 Tax=Prorocentrum cordatum TaxID=2364126 RepID=A0ABN9S0X9_9DINO|nr:unnamed protein product [Polarella glacialis]